jgi:hypothetical protein
MPTHEAHDTHHKALSLNLDTTVFGSFAEIGAGQEVARWFLRVGGASGTVAKTISAYDKQVSDHLYGAGTRYVSKSRLEAVLESEWEQLIDQLHASRGADCRFFSFVDTVVFGRTKESVTFDSYVPWLRDAASVSQAKCTACTALFREYYALPQG